MNIDQETPANLDLHQLRAVLAERLLSAAGRHHAHPLSSAQQRLWFLDQLEPNSPLYNIPSVARLRGNLDLSALQQALDAMVARHEALRTRFVSEDGEPAQVVDAPCAVPLELHDITQVPAEQREKVIQEIVHAEVKRPFNLRTDLLLRATLLHLGPEEYLFIVNMHHIVSDEWSFRIFFSELAKFYAGFMEEKLVELPELPIQYKDYAAWQRQWLQGPQFQEHIHFWKDQLQGNPPGVELPTDYPRPSKPSFGGKVQIHALGPELTEGLKQLAHAQGVTLFMVLLAAFKALLFRYTQQQDIIVGSPMAGRNRMETEGLIGFFVNTLPLRTRVSGEMRFTDLLSTVREVALAAYCHQDLPFDKLVEALQPERSQSNATPFINVMFLTQTDMEKVSFRGLDVQFLDVVTDTSKFDLSLGVQELGDHLISGVEYNTDLFQPSTITRFLQHYECLLQGIVAQPYQCLAELPLLSEAERRQLLGNWQPPASSAHLNESLHRWFERQAAATPHAVAVVCEGSELTYRELNQRANQLAHHLKEYNVAPGTNVALLLERSLDLVVAVLGVLKAGAAYVPMDPACPRERLQFMIADTEAPVIITQAKLLPQLPPVQAKVLCLESAAEQLAAASVENPLHATSGDQVAYIIYTSGSTGQPKGVLVTHQNVVRLFKSTEHWYGFNSADVWTLFHSYTFDFSVWEMWGALLYGGRLVVVPYFVSRSPAEFYDLLSQQKVTVLNQTPSSFRQLIWAEETGPKPLKLRYIIFGGEALELQSLKPWLERHGDEEPLLVNMYGITETTVHVTYRPIRQVDVVNGLGSVIGEPIPDLKIYLLDEKQQPVPVGVPGEICVSGLGVARGYLKRPELTSQKFIPDPFSGVPGLMLYRSGDLARYTSAGELEYLGRIDHQVKIRGFRVELGEIESALNSHPAIRESVVLAASGPGGSSQLVAYFVPVGPPPTDAELRPLLLQRLPEYMVPSVFMPLDVMPLTSNGKVDRRALPRPEVDQTYRPEVQVAPRDEKEAGLVEIWREVLNRKTIGVHDNFFHLGGHSLLATQVAWRISRTFSVELPVRTIFEAPTVAQLARAVSEAKPGNKAGIDRSVPSPDGHRVLFQVDQLSDVELKHLLQDI